MTAIDRRKLAGDIVRTEIAHQGRTQEWAADRMGMASSSLLGILTGQDGVTPMKLRSVAGALGLPRRLLTYVIDGDAAHIRAIGDDEMPPSLRRGILERMSRIEAS